MNIQNSVVVVIICIFVAFSIIYMIRSKSSGIGIKSLSLQELANLISEQTSWRIIVDGVPKRMRIGNFSNLQFVSDQRVSVFYHKSIHTGGQNTETINVCPSFGYAGSIVTFTNGNVTVVQNIAGRIFEENEITLKQQQESQDLLAAVRKLFLEGKN
ncbi:MAG: hypothetical protein WC087_03845 [Candidatus Paceibacterota bacterium]